MSGYLFAPGPFIWSEFLWLSLGGFLVTAASNGFNQVIERKFDAMMKRTEDRPLAKDRMSVAEGLMFSFITAFLGVFILWFFLNGVCAFFAFLSLFMYVVLYTPMKRISPWAVFIGAFPGAMPPLLGYVAAPEGEFGFIAGMLFFIQFFWQFPHFWAIAWVAHDDYVAAGYKLLPSTKGRNRFSSFQILAYAFALIPVSLLPWLLVDFPGLENLPSFNPAVLEGIGWLSFSVVSVCGILFFVYASKLHRTQELLDAKKLMFASFFYLPIVQFIYIIDKL